MPVIVMKTRYLLAFLALLFAPAATAQSAADSAAVRAAALDYLEGWYAADIDRMAGALHPDLAKRIVRVDSAGASRLDAMSKHTLLGITRRGGGSRTPADLQRKDVVILDIEGDNASVKTYADTFFDYVHLARFDGEWRIVNVLWGFLPPDEVARQ
jgi:hypothetical protein